MAGRLLSFSRAECTGYTTKASQTCCLAGLEPVAVLQGAGYGSGPFYINGPNGDLPRLREISGLK